MRNGRDNIHQEFYFNIMKSTFVLIVLIFGTSQVFGQESKNYLRLKRKHHFTEGYILDQDSMKVKGLVRKHMIDESKKHSVVTFVHLDGVKKNYYPNGIKGYGYSVFKFESDNSLFYELVRKGRKASLYTVLSVSYWSVPGGPGMATMTSASSSEDLYVKRYNDTKFKLVRKKNFIAEFSKYFEDCEKVVKKILAKEYTHKDIRRVISEYNFCQ